LPFRGNIALLRSDRGSQVLPIALKEAGWAVTEVPLYSLQLKRSEDMEILLDRLERQEISTLAFATPSHADAFFFNLIDRYNSPEAMDILDGVKIAVLSQDTEEKLGEYGLGVDIVPKRATAEIMIRDIVDNL
jgi:uroporphyrinogen-III synthase